MTREGNFSERGRGDRATAVVLAIVGLVLIVAAGFHPGPDGRWFDPRFWPTVGNTLAFVAWTVSDVTPAALALAAALDRQTRAMGILRTLFFISQVLSVAVVTLIWQIMFSPRQGLIANVSALFGGTPINWLTDQQFVIGREDD